MANLTTKGRSQKRLPAACLVGAYLFIAWSALGSWLFVAYTAAAMGITPLPTPIPAGAANSLWQPIEQIINGVPMVYVPSGCFMMGSDQGRDTEQPVHEVCLAAFWIDKYEVTNVQYQRFIEAGGYERREFWTEAGWQWREEHYGTLPHHIEGFGAPNQPRVGISWYEAYAYARWREARLPTEAEWEYAAGGTEGLLYP